jgi:hypothetical protein
MVSGCFRGSMRFGYVAKPVDRVSSFQRCDRHVFERSDSRDMNAPRSQCPICPVGVADCICEAPNPT